MSDFIHSVSGHMPSPGKGPTLRRSSKPHGPLTVSTQPIPEDLQTEGSQSAVEVNCTISGQAPSGNAKHYIENTYRVEPDSPFKAYEIERMTEFIMVNRLKDIKYNPNRCRELSQNLAAEIMDRVKDLAIRRYKLITMVSIGSIKERPGMQFGSRCLWNKDTDNFVSVKYTNSSLFAVAMIYGLLYE